MKATTRSPSRTLARSRGFLVLASDGRLGTVEMPLTPPDRGEPDYLVVRSRRSLRVRHPVVAVDLVEEVDAPRGLIYLRGRWREIADLLEHLPLAV